jgi:hypothetical protein
MPKGPEPTVPGLGLVTIDHLVPSQCSTRVRPCTVVPAATEKLPTAHMSLGDSAEIPLSWLLAAPAGVGRTSDDAPRSGGGGVRCSPTEARRSGLAKRY